MTLTFEQLMGRNLTGFRFAIGEHRMTMTSRWAYETDPYTVIRDNGDKCVIKMDGRTSYTKEVTKEQAAKYVADGSYLRWDDELKANVNLIDTELVKEVIAANQNELDQLEYEMIYNLKTDSLPMASTIKKMIDEIRDQNVFLKLNLLTIKP
jgi:hypothetical protein